MSIVLSSNVLCWAFLYMYIYNLYSRTYVGNIDPLKVQRWTMARYQVWSFWDTWWALYVILRFHVFHWNVIIMCWEELNTWLDESVPDVISFTTLIGALCTAGKVDEAFGVLDKMVKKGSSPNLYTYNSLIIGLLKTNRLEEAHKILQVMHTHECKPTSFTYNIFMDYYVKQGEFNEAYQVFLQMKWKDIAPDVVSFNLCIDCLGRAGKVREAKDLFEEMRQVGLYTDTITYNMMIRCYGQEGKIELCPGWNCAPVGTLPRLELYPFNITNVEVSLEPPS